MFDFFLYISFCVITVYCAHCFFSMYCILSVLVAVTFRDATSWLRTYAECCLWRTVTVGPVTANFLLIYCDVYVCLVWNSGPF